MTTLGTYRNAINRYVIPHLGGRQLYTLDKRAVNDLYRHLLAKGGRGETPLAAETVRHAHRVLMKLFKDIGIHIDGVRQPCGMRREPTDNRRSSSPTIPRPAGTQSLVWLRSGTCHLSHDAGPARF